MVDRPLPKLPKLGELLPTIEEAREQLQVWVFLAKQSAQTLLNEGFISVFFFFLDGFDLVGCGPIFEEHAS